MPKLILKEGRERSVLRRHPWIYSGAVSHLDGTAKSGETIAVCNSKGEFLAYGAYAPDSQIRAKLWSFDPTQEIHEAFFRARIEQAVQLRKSVFNGRLPQAFRLVNAESDGLPGLVADLYGEYAVCQITGSGMELHRNTIGNILLDFARGVWERSDVDSRLKDGLQLRTGLLAGSPPPDLIKFEENGILFQCNPRSGHKTGFYLDQRMNRKLVLDQANGMDDVLNCFAYTGGFGLAALKGGAKRVWNVDSSAPALEQARIHAAANGFPDDAFQTVTADVFQFLRTCRDSRKSFDMIILDPPKFAESMSQKEKAARAYKDINLLAMKLLRKGGKLFTFSCSGAMDDDLFGKVVDSAACDAKRDFRMTHHLSQGPDHPVAATFPEGRYLKGFAGFVF